MSSNKINDQCLQRNIDSLLSSTENSPKRHKKRKKHRHRQSLPSDEECIDVTSDIPTTSIRIVNRDHTEKHRHSTPNTSKLSVTPPSLKSVPAGKKRKKGKDSGTSSDEERWLDAIESGKLEEVDDELKKIKDPKLMTARQRAMYERSTDKEPSPGGEILMSLPTGYKEKVMTAEAIEKALLKSQKRKQLADEKREKDKKKTMERLLKKQETKQRSQGKNKAVKTQEPVITYHNTYEGATVSLPPDFEFPLKPQVVKDPPKPILCGIPGCSNLKIYNCSKTNLPLCSFVCYRKNVAAVKEIMC
ncbi:INO80 complex subunit B [Episyrphus balteatus]|uniref:INO80 complex subunit B n=1 Tax=Episyrphus balteatus TaxID=286459 RepID=UPI002485A836|nr:INO80 complex subunit B [Episyrphus balteatus]